jgi:hypothetical protein
LIDLGGVQFTVICVFVMANTFIPKGAFMFNPEMLYNESLEENVEKEGGEAVPMEGKNMKVGRCSS